jgi:hypothetical protein
MNRRLAAAALAILSVALAAQLVLRELSGAHPEVVAAAPHPEDTWRPEHARPEPGLGPVDPLRLEPVAQRSSVEEPTGARTGGRTAAAIFEGLVTGPPEFRFDGLVMRVMLLETKRSFETGLEASGRFRFENLPLGLAAVTIGAREAWVGPGKSFDALELFPGTWIELDWLELGPGRNHRDFDITAVVTGYLLVRVKQRGVPVEGMTLHAEAPEPGGPSGAIGKRLSEDGVFRVGPLEPGPWRIGLQSKNGGWRVRSLGVSRVERTGQSSFELDVWIARGTLQVLDAASGAPLAEETIMVRSTEEGYGKAYRSGADGWVELELPVGSFEAARGGGAPPRWGPARAFTWTMAGAVPSAVRLEPAPKGP